MNTYTREREDSPHSDWSTVLAAPGASADFLSLLVSTVTTVPVRLTWSEKSHTALERAAEKSARVVLKVNSALTMKQFTDERLSGFATVSHTASASQKAAAKLRYLRCIN
jgi:hypothetical protein